MGNNAAIDTTIQQAIDETSFDYVEKYISLSALPKIKAAILREEMKDYVSESPCRTATQIAEDIGCHINTVFQAHKDARFLAAKDKIQDMWFQSMAGEVYKAVLDTAKGGKVGAQKLALEVMGKHVTRIESKNVNVTADITSVGVNSIDDSVDRFLTMLGNRGWSLEMIADRWRILKSQQAF
jgi:hypothetical protein